MAKKMTKRDYFNELLKIAEVSANAGDPCYKRIVSGEV